MTIDRDDAPQWLTGFKGQAQVIVFDPPYRTASDSPVRGRIDGAGGQVFGVFGRTHAALVGSFEALVPGGVLVGFCRFKDLPDFGYIASAAGFRLSTAIAWTRSRPGVGGLFRSAWDPITLWCKGTPRAVGSKALRNVVEANPPTGSAKIHPYQKPESLFDYIFQRIVAPGDLVLDPFAGSGSSRAPAQRVGARWRGCDIAGPSATRTGAGR